MIIQCKSCEKKFSVPDGAIGANGRLVQCGSCGQKWTQYPNQPKDKKSGKIKEIPQNKNNFNKPKITKQANKKRIKKQGPTMYSSEYLKKKHGLNISKNESPNKNEKKNYSSSSKIGFFGTLAILIVFITSIFGILHLTQDLIIYNYPFLENYFLYFYETIQNLILLGKGLFGYY